MAQKFGKLEVVIKGGKPWGFQIQANERSRSSVIVHKILHNGKANQQSNLKVGDHIIRINGIPCLSLVDALQLIDSAFRTLTLCIWRAGNTVEEYPLYANYENLNDLDANSSGYEHESSNIYENIELFRPEQQNDIVPYVCVPTTTFKSNSVKQDKSFLSDFKNSKEGFFLREQNTKESKHELHFSTECVTETNNYTNSQEFPFPASSHYKNIVLPKETISKKNLNTCKRSESTSSLFSKKFGIGKLDNLKSHFKKLFLPKSEQSFLNTSQRCMYPNCFNQENSCVRHSPPERESSNSIKDIRNTTNTYLIGENKIDSQENVENNKGMPKYFSKTDTSKNIVKTLSLNSVYSSDSSVSSINSINKKYEFAESQKCMRTPTFFNFVNKQSSVTGHLSNIPDSYIKTDSELQFSSDEDNKKVFFSPIISSNYPVSLYERNSKLKEDFDAQQKNSLSPSSNSRFPLPLSGETHYKFNSEDLQCNSNKKHSLSSRQSEKTFISGKNFSDYFDNSGNFQDFIIQDALSSPSEIDQPNSFSIETQNSLSNKLQLLVEPDYQIQTNNKVFCEKLLKEPEKSIFSSSQTTSSLLIDDIRPQDQLLLTLSDSDNCNSRVKEEAIYANLEEIESTTIGLKSQKEEEDVSFISYVDEKDCSFEDTNKNELKINSAKNDSSLVSNSDYSSTEVEILRTNKESAKCVSQSCTAKSYLETSAPKAKLLTQYTSLLKNHDMAIKELSSEKVELITRIDKKLNILKDEKMGLEDELKQNEELGNSIKATLEKFAQPNEIEKYKRHVDELEKIIHLLKSLSGRIARLENALIGDVISEEKAFLSNKLQKLKQQYEEALNLRKNINNRNNSVSSYLRKYLTNDELADYDHFIHMKVELLEDYKELLEKIKLGEEQLMALRNN